MSKHEKKKRAENNRIHNFKNALGGHIPNMIKECIESESNTSDYMKCLTKYQHLVMDLMNLHFSFVGDVENLYEWLGLSTNWIHSGMFKKVSFKDFMEAYEDSDGAISIMDKILEDLTSVRNEYRNAANG